MQSSPWVYIFSRFTSEALLFEALIICSLCAVYTAFWLLRKRKFGVIKKEVPAGVVKYYLNELIVDAEQLRAQLFGLLTGQGVVPTPIAGLTFGQNTAAAPAVSMLSGQPGAAAGAAGIDPHSAQTLAALEAKLAEQAKQIENFVSEKTRIEQELLKAKSAKGGEAAGPDNSKELLDKIGQLEAKLAEYSVIEDDLANLKRLQQENNSLKSQLAKGGSNEKIAAAPAAVQETLSGSTPVNNTMKSATPASEKTEPAADAGVTAALSSGTEAGAASEPVSLGAPTASSTTESMAANFEGLVDQVEQSLQKSDVKAAPADATAASKKVSSTDAPAPATIEKSDADLVAEFEKMLNG